MFRSMLLLVWMPLVISPVTAQDFRVDTKVFVEEETEPVAKTRTLFVGKYVYDILFDEQQQPQEITILDASPSSSRMILLSPRRKAFAEIPLVRVYEIVVAIRNRVPADDALFHPKFEVQAEDDKLSLISPALSYTVDLQAPKHAGAAKRYQAFSDWTARLNSLRPPNPPSVGREQVNDQLAQRDMLPAKVLRQTKRRGGKPVTISSQHSYIWKLSRQDEQTVADINQQLATFSELPSDKYLVPTQTARK